MSLFSRKGKDHHAGSGSSIPNGGSRRFSFALKKGSTPPPPPPPASILLPIAHNLSHKPPIISAAAPRSFRPQSQVILPTGYSPFPAAKSGPGGASNAPPGSGSSSPSIYANGTSHYSNTTNSYNQSQYQCANGNSTSTRPQSEVYKRRPPPRSVSEYGGTTTKGSTEHQINRKDSVQRRRSIRKANFKDKSLPQVPPNIAEDSPLATLSEQSSLHGHPFGSPFGGGYDSPSQSPGWDQKSDTSGGRQDALEALSSVEPNSTFYRGSSIPKRNEWRDSPSPVLGSSDSVPSVSSIPRKPPSLTSGLSFENPHKIPPRSERRASNWLPFTNVAETGDQLHTQSSAYSSVNRNQGRLSQAAVTRSIQNSAVVNAQPTASQLNDIYDPRNMDISFQTAATPLSYVAGSVPVAAPEYFPQQTAAKAFNAPQSNTRRPSGDYYVPPLYEGSSFKDLLDSLWTPVLRNDSLENKSKSRNQSSNEPQIKSPDTVQGQSLSDGASSSSYLIDDSVLSFGDTLGDWVNQADYFDVSVNTRDTESKKQLLDKLERKATINLKNVVSKCKKKEDAQIILNEITAISKSADISHNGLTKSSPGNSPLLTANLQLESELEKYRLIIECLDRKNIARPLLSDMESKTSLSDANIETFDPPSFIDDHASNQVIAQKNAQFENYHNSTFPEADKADEFSNNSDGASTVGGSSMSFSVIAKATLSDQAKMPTFPNFNTPNQAHDGNLTDPGATGYLQGSQKIIVSSSDMDMNNSSPQNEELTSANIGTSLIKNATQIPQNRPRQVTRKITTISEDLIDTVFYAQNSGAQVPINFSRSHSTRPISFDRSSSMNTQNSVFTNFSVISPVETVMGTLSGDLDGIQGTDSDDTINIIDFSASSLKPLHLKQCREVWSLSGVFHWLLKFNRWFEGQTLRKKEIVLSLELLIKYHYPKATIGVLGELVALLADEFKESQCISENVDIAYERSRGPQEHVNDFEDMLIISFNTSVVPPSGVITPLLKCYSSKFCTHNVGIQGSDGTVTGELCYSIYCPHEPEKQICIPVPEVKNPNNIKDSWAEYWSISESEMKSLDNRTIVFQSRTYDLIKKQHKFIDEANHLVNYIGQEFMKYPGSEQLVYPELKQVIHYSMFETVIPLIKSHDKYLFQPMKKVLLEQGKFIHSGIFELYKKWTKDSFPHYIEYIDHLAGTLLFIGFEKMKKTSLFLEWLDSIQVEQRDPRKLLSNHFFYGLIQNKDSLNDIKKKVLPSDPQWASLNEAIAISTIFCDKIHKRFGSAEVHELFKHFVWRIPPTNFNIEFNPEKMKFITKGDALKKSAIGRWSATKYYLILFSNSLFLTEVDTESRVFKVIEKPIPIELVGWEIPNVAELEENTARIPNDPDKKVKDSLKIIHHGQKSVWAFKFSTTHSRGLWIKDISAALSEAVKENNLQFRFNAVATNLQAASYQNLLGSSPSTLPIIRASNNILQYSITSAEVKKVLCSSVFIEKGKKFYLIGTNAGLFLRSDFDPWVKIGSFSYISQLEYVADANLVLVLADKKFMQVMVEDLVKYFYAGSGNLSSLKLSNKNVAFFIAGHMEGTFSVLYMKVKISGSGSPCRLFKRLSLDMRRKTFKVSPDFSKFFLSVECTGGTICDSSAIIKTERGFMMIDPSLAPGEIPKMVDFGSLGGSHSREAEFFEMVHYRATNEKPIASFAVHSGKEILLVFATFAVFCNERGFLSKVKCIEFNIKCTGAAIDGNTLFLVSKNAIEVFDIANIDTSPSPKGFITGDNLEIVNHDSVNRGSFMFLAANPKDESKMLLELVD